MALNNCGNSCSFNVGFIGGGNMSTAIVKAILKSETHLPKRIWVSGPHIENLAHFAELGTNVTDRNGVVYAECEIIFLGVKPHFLNKAVEDCIRTLPQNYQLGKHVCFVSMLAGITIETLEKALQGIANDLSVIRIMPNTPVTVGAGACLYTPNERVTELENARVEKLMSSSGLFERVPEYLMDSLGSLVGCGPAYMFLVIEALADGAVKQGAPRALAQRLAAQMVMGSGLMVLKSGKHPGLLKDEVCSPGGSTIAGVAELEEGKIRSLFIRAIEASTLRSKELGKK